MYNLFEFTPKRTSNEVLIAVDMEGISGVTAGIMFSLGPPNTRVDGVG